MEFKITHPISRRPHRWLAALCLAAQAMAPAWAGTARNTQVTEVPATYKGKPWLGVPRAIPGRIDFEEYDLGGVNVAWKTDDKAGQGVAPGSTAAIRANDGEADHPAFWITNTNPGEVDKLPDGSLYPAEGDHKSIYIGAAHASDYADITVNVAQAGAYYLSSHFASLPNQIQFHVSFNGVNKTGPVTLAGTGDYHAWRFYHNFAKVNLDAGVQVMQFYLDSYHLNWDYIFLSPDSNATVALNSRPSRSELDRPWGGLSASQSALLTADGKLRLHAPQSGRYEIQVLDARGKTIAEARRQSLTAGFEVVELPGMNRVAQPCLIHLIPE